MPRLHARVLNKPFIAAATAGRPRHTTYSGSNLSILLINNMHIKLVFVTRNSLLVIWSLDNVMVAGTEVQKYLYGVEVKIVPLKRMSRLLLPTRTPNLPGTSVHIRRLEFQIEKWRGVSENTTSPCSPGPNVTFWNPLS